MVSKGNKIDEVCFVARGALVEKNGEFEDKVPQMKFVKGKIAGLQNLLPDTEQEEQESNIYCHDSSICAVEFLNLRYLKSILDRDRAKLLKFWHILAYRTLIINYNKPKLSNAFGEMKQENLKLFIKKCCEIKIYEAGELIDLRKGGVLLRGGMKKLNISFEDATNREKLNTQQHDFSKEKKLAQSHKYSSNNNILEKKKTMKELSKNLKEITSSQQPMLESVYEGIQTIRPRTKQLAFMQRNYQNHKYTVIMHFGSLFAQIIHESNITVSAMKHCMEEQDFLKKDMKNGLSDQLRGSMSAVNTITFRHKEENMTHMKAADKKKQSNQNLNNLGFKRQSTNATQSVVLRSKDNDKNSIIGALKEPVKRKSVKPPGLTKSLTTVGVKKDNKTKLDEINEHYMEDDSIGLTTEKLKEKSSGHPGTLNTEIRKSGETNSDTRTTPPAEKNGV